MKKAEELWCRICRRFVATYIADGEGSAPAGTVCCEECALVLKLPDGYQHDALGMVRMAGVPI